MKYKLTFIILFFTILQLNAQTYTITFNAHGASNTIDSIQTLYSLWWNNQCKRFTVNGTDILYLNVQTGYFDIKNTEKITFYPNPFIHQTKMSFYNKNNTKGNIQIFNVLGQLIYEQMEQIPEGRVMLMIEGLRKGTYLIKIKFFNTILTAKLISLNNTGNEDIKIKIENSSFEQISETQLKVYKNNIYVDIEDEGWLIFKAFSGKYSTIETLWLTQSTTNVGFNFIECTDADSNSYTVAKIGNNTWMTENLRTIKYNDGTPIQYIGNDTLQWQNNTNGAYCFYENDTNNYILFGALYNWLAVDTNSNGHRSLCPGGWHVSTNAEWNNLISYLGGQNIYSGVADDLKASCSDFWQVYYHANNRTGFSALPGGSRNYNGAPDISVLGYQGMSFWWTANDFNADDAQTKSVEESEYVSSPTVNKTCGAYIRCIKD